MYIESKINMLKIEKSHKMILRKHCLFKRKYGQQMNQLTNKGINERMNDFKEQNKINQLI